MIFALAACGGSNGEPEAQATGAPEATAEPAAEPTTEPTAEPAAEEAAPAETDATAQAEEPAEEPAAENGSKVLVAWFSCTGNTAGVAGQIAAAAGADLYEIVPEQPYTDADLDYGDSSSRSTVEQNDDSARPAINGSVENMEQYDTVFIGYPNWWASIPMPIASFLEEYDFTGKTIVPFCSHGGGRFGQSLTAIAKLVPDTTLGEGLSVHYSGGSELAQDVTDWLELNQIPTQQVK